MHLGAPHHNLVLCCATLLAACTNEATSSPPTIVELDSQADAFVVIDLFEHDIVRFQCDLERCRYQLTFEEVDIGPGVVEIGVGSLEDVESFRSMLLMGRVDSAPDGIEERRHTADDIAGGLPMYFNFTRGDYYGVVRASGTVTTPRLTVGLRNVPDLENGAPLAPWTSTTYEAMGMLDGETHAFTMPIEDVITFFGVIDPANPVVHVEVYGEVANLDLASYYVCSEGGASFEGGPTRVHEDRRMLEDQVWPDCPGLHDDGSMYIEVTGHGAYHLLLHGPVAR